MIKIAYASFGRDEPAGLSGLSFAIVWLLCAAFLLAAMASTVVLNFFTLFTGTLVSFIGRDGVRFRFLKFFGKVPVIAIALPVLLGYALWHQSRLHGFWFMVWPMLAVWVLGAVSIALAAGFGQLIKNSRS
jgi:hypothetical protein